MNKQKQKKQKKPTLSRATRTWTRKVRKKPLTKLVKRAKLSPYSNPLVSYV